MADVDTGDILRLGLGMRYDTFYDVVNVYHVLTELDGGKTWAQITTFVQTYAALLTDEIEAELSDKMADNDISIANITQDTVLGTVDWNPHWTGDDTSDVLPAPVCCLTWARTYKPRVQIRKYIGAFGEGDCVAGIWNSDVRDACEALMTLHISRTSVSGDNFFTGVAYSRAHETYELAHSVASSPEPAYQRRRKRGVGS